MSDGSKIEWTDATWNPVRGCVKVSAGCKRCYAETFAERFRGVPNHPYQQGFEPRLVENKLSEPLFWAQPRRVFVNSMSDLFQDAVPDDYVRRVFEVMAVASWHTYQVLTKRAERMAQLVRSLPPHLQSLPNVWLGVSVENRRHGVPRIDSLRATPCFIRFLSIEPLLEHLGQMEFCGLDWVIVGGESGRGARPMDAKWVRDIRDACSRDAVPFFFKQWGGPQKSKTGRVLDGRTYDDYPAPHGHCPPSPPSARERRRMAESLGLKRRRLPLSAA